MYLHIHIYFIPTRKLISLSLDQMFVLGNVYFANLFFPNWRFFLLHFSSWPKNQQLMYYAGLCDLTLFVLP